MKNLSLDELLRDLVYEDEIGSLYGSTSGFVRDIHEQYKRNKSLKRRPLTESQEKALRKIHARIMG